MKATYIFDKEHGSIDMYCNDRRDVNHLADTQDKALARFIEMLSATMRYMNDGETFTIEVSKEG